MALDSASASASSATTVFYQGLEFDNPRLRDAYIALQAWKGAIYSDPYNVTGSWVGDDVCVYDGIYCTDALDYMNCLIHERWAFP